MPFALSVTQLKNHEQRFGARPTKIPLHALRRLARSRWQLTLSETGLEDVTKIGALT
jgi:hypothetical protein